MPNTLDPNSLALREGLANIAVEFQNEETIWRGVAPVIRVSQRSGTYRRYDEDTNFNQTEDALGTLTKANEIMIGHSQDNYSVKDRGLAAWVPQSSIDEAEAADEDPIDPLGRAEVLIRRQLENRHEKRVADSLFVAATYPAGFKATLSGSDQFSHADAKPIDRILTSMDIPLQRPNTLVFGAETWRAFRTNPSVVATIFPAGGNAGEGGMVTSAAVLNALRDEGIERILIGRRRLNTAKPGATPVYARIWGKHCLLAYVDPSPTAETYTFAGTFVETLTNPTIDFDEQVGVKGSYRVQDAWNEDVQLIAAKAAYFLENATA
jgi:hypothetical protein